MKQSPENPSGIWPTEHKVLIRPLKVEEKIGSIHLPDQLKDKEKYAQIRGHIVAASPLAFTYANEAEWTEAGGVKPRPGDQVLYGKYAGFNVRGPKDGVEYTVVNDKDICALIEE